MGEIPKSPQNRRLEFGDPKLRDLARLPQSEKERRPDNTTRTSVSALGNITELYRQYKDNDTPIHQLKLPEATPFTETGLIRTMTGIQMHALTYFAIVMIRSGLIVEKLPVYKSWAIPDPNFFLSHFPNLPEELTHELVRELVDMRKPQEKKKLAKGKRGSSTREYLAMSEELLRLHEVWRNAHDFVKPQRRGPAIGGVQFSPEDIAGIWEGKAIRAKTAKLARKISRLYSDPHLTGNINAEVQKETLEYGFSSDLLPWISYPLVLEPYIIVEIPVEGGSVYTWAQPDILYQYVGAKNRDHVRIIDIKTGIEGKEGELSLRERLEILTYRLAAYALFYGEENYGINSPRGDIPFIVSLPANFNIEGLRKRTRFYHRVPNLGESSPYPWLPWKTIPRRPTLEQDILDYEYLIEILGFYLRNKKTLGPIIRQSSRSSLPDVVFPKVVGKDTSHYQPPLVGLPFD